MINELQTATLAGRYYNDIQDDVVKLVNYYTNIFYQNYPVLAQHGCDKETIVMDVYRGLSLRTKDDGLSNLERHFIKASKIENCTMAYISNLIRKSVMMSLMCISRDISKKPICDSLDRAVYSDGTRDISLADTVQDTSESLESLVELKLTLESIKHKKFKEYHTVTFFGDKVKLSTKDVLDWIISGYKISEMCSKVFKHDGSNIDYNNMNKIRKETISLAREAFYGD